MTPKIHVTYLINDMLRGGAEALLCDVANRLDRKTFAVTVVTLHDVNEFPLLPDVTVVSLDERFGVQSPLGRMSSHMPWRKRRRAEAGGRHLTDSAPAAMAPPPRGWRVVYRHGVLFSRVWRTLRTIPTDILHTHLQSADDYGQMYGAFGSAKRVYTTIHNSVEWPRDRVSAGHLVEDALLRVPDRVIACSDHLRDYVLDHRGARPERVVTVHNGIDVERFADARVNRSAVRSRLGWDSTDFVVICVAQFRGEKRHDLLLRAFDEAALQISGARLVLVGNSGECISDVRAQIATSPFAERIQIVAAQRDEIPALLGAADVFTMHSEHEGLPLAALEALAAGLPGVVPDHAPFPEVVRHGQDGYLFPWGSVHEHAASLTRIAHDLREHNRFWSGTQSEIRARYSIQTHVQKLAALYIDDLSKQFGPFRMMRNDRAHA